MSTVALYSGGMDSEALRLLYRPDVLLYVEMGTKYERAELQHLPASVQRVPLALDVWERPDAIIPLRNLFLVAVAAQYGDIIMLGATAGDRVLDKSDVFASLTTQLLAFLWSPQHWTEGRDIAVTLPLRTMTKRQIVERVHAEQGMYGVRELADSFSCYTPRTVFGSAAASACGACKPCARKWIAFAAAGFGSLVPDASSYVREHVAPTITERGAVEAADLAAALAWRDRRDRHH